MVSFAEHLAFGEEGENLIAQALIRRGAIVSPLYQYEGHSKPPAVYCAEGTLTHPDLTCWSKGKNFFAEIKRKQRWVHPWARGHLPGGGEQDGRGLETGFNARLYENYRKVSAQTGAPLWVFFIHEKEEPCGVFIARLADLEPHARLWDGRRRGGERISKPEALFPHRALRRFWTLAEVGL
jgi:hypothetical protein